MSIALTKAGFGCALQFTYTAGTAYRPRTETFPDVSGIDQPFAIGTDAGQVNKPFATRLTLNSASPTLLDLTNLTDDSGEAVSFAAIEGLKISLKSTTPGEDLTVGGGTNAVFGVLPVLKATARGDSVIEIVSPIIVDGTHKNLQLAPATGTAVIVTITLIGR